MSVDTPAPAAGGTAAAPPPVVRRSVVGSAKLIAGCTLLSRVTGLARDMLLVQTFGLGWVQDAFAFAFQIPNLFRRLFGEGAMAPVFVPTFARALETDGRDAAWRLLARTLALLTTALAAIVILIGVVLVACWFALPQGAEERRLLVWLTGMMLPFTLTICVVALLSAILNCVGSFVPAALTSVVLNLAMIVGIAFAGPAVLRGLGRSAEEFRGPAPGGGTLVVSARPGSPVHLAITDAAGRTTTHSYSTLAELEQAQPAAARPLNEALAVKAQVVALSVLAAGVLQLLFLYPALRANGVRLGWRFEPRDPTVRHMSRLFVPVLLGQGALAFGVFLDGVICLTLSAGRGGGGWLGASFPYPLQEGALSAITYAQRLYQFPLGVLVISLATAALPAFSRLAARGDWAAWTREVRQDLRLAVFEGILAGTLMLLLAVPIVRLLFQRGIFTAAETQRAAYVLGFYGLGLWAFCGQHMVQRAFYSTGDVRTPLALAVALLPLNALLSLALVWVPAIREAAFAISACLTSGLGVLIGAVILQRRTQTRILDARMAGAAARMLAAAALTAAAVWRMQPLWAELGRRVPAGLAEKCVTALGPLAVGTALFLAIAWVLRLPEVGLLLPWRLRRKQAANLPDAHA